jgi:tetraacyldisaccharide 4'-kinase
MLLRRGSPGSVPGLKVISVGNLSVGGSGKSPLVEAIGRMLPRKELALLTRGYGGDEALMLESALPGALVVVGVDRLAAAREARKRGRSLALLDDGFQRRHQLGRQLDILVLDWQRRDLERHCLPAGRLREPLSAAARAQAVVVTHAPPHWNAAALRVGLPGPYQGLRVFRGDHAPLRLRGLRGGFRPLSWLRGRAVTAMSGIGKPEAFERMLAGLGARVRSRRFSDHHAYNGREIPEKGLVVTTAKDAVKLKALQGAGAEIWVLEIEMRLSPGKDFEAMIRQ